LFVDGMGSGAEVTAAPYTFALNTMGLTNGNHTLVVRARDAAGNVTDSAAITVNVNNAVSDTVAPTVSLTAPAAGTVTGMVTLTATAMDNVGVVGVTFLVNGTATGVEDTSPP